MDSLSPLGTLADERVRTSSVLRVAAALNSFAVVVAALYFGQEMLVPLVLAAVLAFVLAPLVHALERLRLPRLPAVLLAVLAAFVVIGLLSTLVGQQVSALAGDVPRYETNVLRKWQALVTSHPALGRLIEPVTQGLSENRGLLVSVAERVAAPVLGPLATALVVLVFALVFLLYSEDLRDRFVRLVGRQDLHRTIFAMNDAGRRLSRYFLSQLTVNAGFGVWIGAGLMLIGLPGAILMGLIAALMRFVPFIGTGIALVAPVALAVAVSPGWTMALLALALFLASEIVVSQVVEPLLYGHSTGVSPVAVLVAASFWAMLWGFVGLLLAMPLTVCLVVMGKHVPGLAFLDVLFGSETPLLPSETFYQRALEGRSLTLLRAAQKRIAEASAVEYYDRVALPGLVLAQADGLGEGVDDDKLEAVRGQVSALLQTLAPPQSVPSADLLCLPARGPLDDLGVEMVAASMRSVGWPARVAANTVLDNSAAPGAALEAVRLCCLSVLEIGATAAQVRYFVRRIQQQMPSASVVVGLWGAAPSSALLETVRSEGEGEHVVLSIGELIAFVRAISDSDRSRK